MTSEDFKMPSSYNKRQEPGSLQGDGALDVFENAKLGAQIKKKNRTILF